MTVVIGLVGGSASGKSTLAKRLCAWGAAQPTPAVTSVEIDRYYRPLSSDVDPATHNFDEPAALDLAACAVAVQALRAGRSVEVPRYDFSRHARFDQRDVLMPAPVVLVEGLFVLSDAALRDAVDVGVYLSASEEIRLARRTARDVAERGRTAEDVRRQFRETVEPMHKRWVMPQAAHAQVVLNGEAPPDVLWEAFVSAVGPRVPGLAVR